MFSWAHNLPEKMKRFLQGLVQPSALLGLLAVAIIGIGASYRIMGTYRGLPYPYWWDEPEIVNPAIRLLREGVYRPTRYAYGPINAYVHAAWGVWSVLKAVQSGEIRTVWDLKSDWDTGWYWTISSPIFYQQARFLSVLMWLVAVFALWRSCLVLKAGWGGIVALSMLAFSQMNFEQTSTVSVGALASMFAALSFWGGIRYVVSDSKSRQLLFWSAVAAAASVATKLVFLPILCVPFVAHLVTLERCKGRRNWTVFWGLAGVALSALVLLMLPAFFDPPRFVHGLTAELQYYGKEGTSLGFWRHLRQAVLALLAGAEAADVRAIAGEFRVVSWRLSGFVYVLLGIWGGIALGRRVGIAALIVIPAFLNAWQVSGYPGEFYTRNVMITQLCWAVSAAVGFEALRRWSARLQKPRQEVLAAVVIALCLYPAAGLWRFAKEYMTLRDSRVLAARELDEQATHTKEILAAAELHWFIPSGPKSNDVKMTQASVTRLLRHPEEATRFDLLILPAQLATFSRSHSCRDTVREWNNELAKFSSLKSFGANLTYFDRPTTDPKILFVSPSEFQRAGIRRDARRIWGFEMYSPANDGACYLTREGIAAKNYFKATATLTLPRPAQQIVVNARGTNPFEQDEPPQVGVRVFATTDTAQKSPVANVVVDLKRSGTGFAEYPVRTEIPAGEYVVHIATKNPNRRFMTELQYIEFR